MALIKRLLKEKSDDSTKVEVTDMLPVTGNVPKMYRFYFRFNFRLKYLFRVPSLLNRSHQITADEPEMSILKTNPYF